MTSIILQSKISCFIAVFRTYFRNIRGRKFEPEIEFLKYVLKSGDICMHIGASDARHSYIMSTLIGDGEIYAFEPSSYSYQHLKLILKLHRIRNAHIYKKAVSDKNDVVSLVTPIKSSGRAGRSFAFITALDRLNAKRSDVANNKYIKEEVETVSIDSFVSRENIGKIDFIRCDTEGAEILVLKGAMHTLERDKPNILIEIHNQALKDIFDSNADEVKNILTNLGYLIFRIDDGKPSLVKNINDQERWKDYFFIHPDRHNELPEGPFRNHLDTMNMD